MDWPAATFGWFEEDVNTAWAGFNASQELPVLEPQLPSGRHALRVMCLLIKDEAQYMREWLNFHRAWGWDRFVVYDDGSTDGLRAALDRFPEEEIDYVDVKRWPVMRGMVHVQCAPMSCM